MSRQARLDVARTSSAPRLARRFVVATLEEWAAGSACERAELLVSELVTNVIRHATSSPRVVITDEDGCVRIEVFDGGPGGAIQQEPGTVDVGGHGLLLVAAIADRWGAAHDENQHVVWCEIRKEQR
jgi:anti-sigma regulatory factor (Ser/Thr protein kinase)